MKFPLWEVDSGPLSGWLLCQLSRYQACCPDYSRIPFYVFLKSFFHCNAWQLVGSKLAEVISLLICSAFENAVIEGWKSKGTESPAQVFSTQLRAKFTTGKPLFAHAGHLCTALPVASPPAWLSAPRDTPSKAFLNA